MNPLAAPEPAQELSSSGGAGEDVVVSASAVGDGGVGEAGPLVGEMVPLEVLCGKHSSAAYQPKPRFY